MPWIWSEVMCLFRMRLEAKSAKIVKVWFCDGLQSFNEIYLCGFLRCKFFRWHIKSFWILLFFKIHMLKSLSPIMRLSHCQWSMFSTTMRFKTFWLDAGCIDRVLVLIFHISNLALELGLVDCGPALKEKYLVELGVIVGWSIRLICDSEKVRVTRLSRDSVERGELFHPWRFVHLHAEGFVDALTLGLL